MTSNTSLAAQMVAWAEVNSATIAAGCRLALILFAVMSGLAWLRNGDEGSALERWRRRGWMLLTVAALAASPLRAVMFMGYEIPDWAGNLADAVATSCASGCFMCSLAARGFMRGLSEQRVSRGAWVNVGVLLAVVGATTWLSR